MDYAKPKIQSLGVWAGSITAVSGLIVLIGKLFEVELLQDEIEQIIYAGIVVILGIVSVYGRIRAKTKLK